jgi:hypothetical protein
MKRCPECNVLIVEGPRGWTHVAAGVAEVLLVLRCKSWSTARPVPDA